MPEFKKGFTLLELLVVMAIIGLFVAISMAYMSNSKSRGSDAGIKTNLVNARSQAEVFFINQNRSYEGVCNDSSTGIFRQTQAAARAYGISPKATYTDTVASTWNTEECHDTTNAYALWVPLKASTSASPLGWCVDSRSETKKVTAVLAANATRCP